MKKAPFLPVLIGTGFGSGFSPFAPGTAGALLASIIWIALYLLLPFSVVLWITAALVIVFTFAGIWAADKLEACWGEDPSRVVVDEMVGVWIPGYLILFAPHAFEPQCQLQSSKPPSPLVFLLISTHFTATLGIPLASPTL